MSSPLPQEFWDHEVTGVQQVGPDWLWHGLLARDSITLLTSLWKSGKTTLLSHLLARRKEGGTLLDLPVTAGKTVVISEEPRALWEERIGRLGFGGRVCLFCRPFARVPASEEWQGLLTRVADLRDRHGVDLVVLDPLTHFVRQESTARGMLDTLLPLRALSARGMAALVMHHPRKGEPAAGQAGRGNGALLSHVDISIEMRHAGDDLDTRARRFSCQSRYTATPRRLLFELNRQETDYAVLHDTVDEDFQRQRDVLRMVLEDASQKLTRQDILDEWPADFAKPCPAKLWKWLTRAVTADLILTEGTGRKTDPFRYWLHGAEDRWRDQNPLYDIIEKQRQDLKLTFRSLGDAKRKAAEHRRVDRDLDFEPDSNARLWPPGSPRE